MPGLRLTRQELICLIFILFLAGCQKASDTSSWQTEGKPVNIDTSAADKTLILGDIDPDTPTRRIQNIRPLADILARKLGWPETRIKVRIAQSIDQMANMLADGRVDIYLDSAYPSLLVRRASGSEIVLLSRILGERTYNARIIAMKTPPISSVEQLKGKTIAFQERYSTSGYLLPAVRLLNSGINLQALASPAIKPAVNRVGFIFSGDEENTLALMRKRVVAAGAISSNDFESLDPVVRDELDVLAVTQRAPRKLVSLRPGFDTLPRDDLLQLLLQIDEIDQAYMQARGWNWDFETLDTSLVADMNTIEEMMDIVPLGSGLD